MTSSAADIPAKPNHRQAGPPVAVRSGMTAARPPGTPPGTVTAAPARGAPYRLMTLDGDTVTAGRTITLAQRRKAGDLLGHREPRLGILQRIAVVDAMAHWLGETGDDELATALAEVVCADPGTARELITVLTNQPGPSPGGSRMMDSWTSITDVSPRTSTATSSSS